MERTRERPLAAGRLSMRQATAFLGAQLTVGLAVLTQLNYNRWASCRTDCDALMHGNYYSIALGAASLPLVVAYPLAKRFTDWPQFVLGLTFSWGALLGWTAVMGTNDFAVTLPLYAGGVSWTLFYDTIYAHQDKDDDRKIGVRSTALTLGADTKRWLTGFALASSSLASVAGYMNGQSWPFYVGAGASLLHMLYLTRRVDINDRASCLRAFQQSQYSGWLLSAGLVADLLL